MASADVEAASTALAAIEQAHRALADVGRSLQRASALSDRAAAAQSSISQMLGDLTIRHRWSGTRLEIMGPEGYVTGPDLQGRPGAGLPGKSAYDIWLASGNEGTVGDYLAALRGESFRPNSIGPGALRSQFDNRPNGYAYLATDEERLYFRVGDEAGAWSDPVPFGRGETGRTPELDADGESIRWRYTGDEVWRALVSLQSLRGGDGREVQIRATSTHLQWRYAGEAAWRDLVLIADLQAAADAAVDAIVGARDDALSAIAGATGPIEQAVLTAQQAAGVAAGASEQAQSARLWADAPPDVLVDDGVHTPGYSARHWAGKASEAAEFDPAAYLTKASNLAGLDDRAAARQNLDLGSAATADAAAFASAAQGDRADTALQGADLDGYAKTADLPGPATASAAGLMSVGDKGKLDGIASGATANLGTVTSVGITPPTGLTATAPVTTSGTLTLSWAVGYRPYTDAEATKLSGLTAQVPADWSAASGPAQILNKPASFPPSAHAHAIGDVTNLSTQLAAKAPLASPALTGTPTVPTATAGTASTQAASTKFVADAIAALIASAPGALDTLDELAAAMGDDPNFAATVTTALGGKLAKTSNLSDLTDVAAARTALQLGSAALSAAAAFANAAQGAKADSAVQPAALGAYVLASALSAVATSGSYADLSNRPTIPDAIAIAAAATVLAGADTTSAMGVKQTWDAMAPVAVASSTTPTINLAGGINFATTLAHNATAQAPTGAKLGQVITWTITQDGTGSRTLSYAPAWKFAGGAPSLSTAAGAKDKITGHVVSLSPLEIHAKIEKDFK